MGKISSSDMRNPDMRKNSPLLCKFFGKNKNWPTNYTNYHGFKNKKVGQVGLVRPVGQREK